jgi:hypothetical protein
MIEDGVSIDDVCRALSDCHLVENYPEHERGACCLVCGTMRDGRYLHVVCTTSLEWLVVITVYLPTEPKWKSPFERGKKT